MADIGFVKRGQGNWWQARGYLEEALQDNLLSANQLTDLAGTQVGMRLYAAAERTFQNVISLVSNRPDVLADLRGMYLI